MNQKKSRIKEWIRKHPKILAYALVLRKHYRHLKLLNRKFIALVKFNIIWPILIRDKEIENINLFEHKVYSQNGEDGIIMMIFRKIGTTNKFCVELGVGDGSECNTRYLIEKKGFKYLHIDAGNYPKKYTDIKKEFITAENINDLFKKYNVPEEFDLLSIDIDYNTYWVWKALEGYKPRVVVIEYNSSIPPTESKAVNTARTECGMELTILEQVC